MQALLHTVLPALQQATANPRLCQGLWTLTGKSGSVSCGGSLLLSPGSWCTQVSVCAHQEFLPQPCVISGGSMVGLMATSSKRAYAIQVCCTQSPRPCSSPLLAHNFTGDTQTHFCLSLCGVFGPWCTQGLFEPSERLWWVWDLILNMISPLLPFCWSFSFALKVTPAPRNCCSNSYHLAGASLPMDMGYQTNSSWRAQTKACVHRTQEKGAVTPHKRLTQTCL